MIYSAHYSPVINSGPYSSKIAWIDFGPNLKLFSGEYTQIYNTLPNGCIISFKLSQTIANDISIQNNTIYITAVPSPNSVDAPFGNIEYLDIPGNIILTSNISPITGNLICITLYDITVLGLPCKSNNYSLVVADSDTVENGKAFALTTNGSPWSLINLIRPRVTPIDGPVFNGIGAQSVTERGISNRTDNVSAGIYASSNPSAVTINFISNGTSEGATIGIMINEFPAPLLNDNSSDTVFVFPNSQFCYKFCSEDCCTNKNFCISLSLDGSLQNILPQKDFCGNLGHYSINHNTITLFTTCNLQQLTFDKLTFLIKENGLRYFKTLLFIYNPSFN